MFEKITEQPSLYDRLEEKSTREILEDINREDRKVAEAVSRTIPMIERLVEQIVPRMEQGGRLFYMGAGTSGRLGVLDASEIPPTFGMPPKRQHRVWLGRTFEPRSELLRYGHRHSSIGDYTLCDRSLARSAQTWNPDGMYL